MAVVPPVAIEPVFLWNVSERCFLFSLNIYFHKSAKIRSKTINMNVDKTYVKTLTYVLHYTDITVLTSECVCVCGGGVPVFLHHRSSQDHRQPH